MSTEGGMKAVIAALLIVAIGVVLGLGHCVACLVAFALVVVAGVFGWNEERVGLQQVAQRGNCGRRRSVPRLQDARCCRGGHRPILRKGLRLLQAGRRYGLP